LSKKPAIDPVLKKFGGGARDLEVRIVESSPIGSFLVLHLIYDVRDAMETGGNTALRTAGPRIEAMRVDVCICASCQSCRPPRAKARGSCQRIGI
jgi:hydroxymethylglutaryl-CoA reductase